MANGTAPVCPISRDQPVPTQPPAAMIPPFRAQDLPSLIAALNAAISNLNRLLGPGLPVNNFAPRKLVQPGRGSVDIQSYWYERGRIDADGSIYNYEGGKFDRTQRVDVTRIYAVEFSAEGSSVNQPMDWTWPEQPYNDGALQ
jgi:hypothetical protein